MDARLHAERLGPRAPVDPRALPDGAFVGGPAACWRIERGRGRRWSWDGYGDPVALAQELPLVTPPSIVRVLEAGYTPAS